MKHKVMKFISILVIAALIWQNAAFAIDRVCPNRTSPSSNLRARALEEREDLARRCTLPAEPDVEGLAILDRAISYSNYLASLVYAIAGLSDVEIYTISDGKQTWEGWIDAHTIRDQITLVSGYIQLLEGSLSRGNMQESRENLRTVLMNFRKLRQNRRFQLAVIHTDPAQETESYTKAGTESDPVTYPSLIFYFMKMIFVEGRGGAMKWRAFQESITRMEQVYERLARDIRAIATSVRLNDPTSAMEQLEMINDHSMSAI